MPQRHRLAVQEARVLRLRFERMAERVAEIQDAAQIRLPARRLDTTSALMRTDLGDDVVHRVRIARQHIAVTLGQQLEQAGARGSRRT